MNMAWRFGISTGACTESPIREMLPLLRGSGAAAVEVGTPPRHFDPWQDDQVEALDAHLRETGLPAVSIHAPFGRLLDLADPNSHHRHAAIGAILTAGSAIRRLGGRLVVVHPSDLERQAHDVPARLADSAGSLAILAENCRQAGITLVVETPLPHLIGGHPDEFAWLLRDLDDSVCVCLDTGHAALGGHWHRFLDVSGARLCHVHANDNRGQWDDHLPPGDGIINWFDIAESLRSRSFDGWIMLELACPGANPADYFRRACEQAAQLFGAGPANAGAADRCSRVP